VSGIQLDVGALLAGGGAALAPVPILLLALLLARGLPAILFRAKVDTRGVLAAALLQATTLPFIVATTGAPSPSCEAARDQQRNSPGPHVCERNRSL